MYRQAVTALQGNGSIVLEEQKVFSRSEKIQDKMVLKTAVFTRTKAVLHVRRTQTWQCRGGRGRPLYGYFRRNRRREDHRGKTEDLKIEAKM